MRAHVFVDAENISPKIFKTAYHKLKGMYEVFRCDIYGKLDSLPKTYDGVESDSRVAKHNVFFGKNSADTFMCTDITKACYTEPLTDVFVIMTEDRDFSCAIKVLVDNDKQTVCVTGQHKLMSNLDAIGVDLNKIINMEIPTVVQPVPYNTNHTCFFNFGNTIREVPFYDGIPLSDFGKILSDFNLRRYYGKNRRLYTICEDNLLKVENGRVYFRKEYEYID